MRKIERYYTMNKLNNYYNNLKMTTSAEDMAKRVVQAPAENARHISFRKPAIVAAAAAVVLVGGVTAGAVTGLIGFDEIFSNIRAESPELSESLAGIADNISTNISDDDYVVSLSGVSGSPASLLANIKLARADGSPIIGSNDNGNVYIDLEDFTLASVNTSEAQGFNYAIRGENDDGGYLLETDIKDDGGVSGSTASYSIKDGVIDIDWEAYIGYHKLIAGEIITGGDVAMKGTVEFTDGEESKAVDFDISFLYTPSEQSMKILRATDLSQGIQLNSLVDYKDNEAVLEPVQCDISAMTFTSTTGIILMNISDEEFEGLHFYGLNNNLRLIKKNGEEVNAHITQANRNGDGDTYLIMHYYDFEQDTELAIDVTEIESISIDGTIIELA